MTPSRANISSGSRTTRNGRLARFLAWRGRRGEEGSALILVLVISVALVIAATTAIAATSSSLNLSSGYGSSIQSNLAAQAGLNTLLAQLRYEASATGTYLNFACGLAGTSSLPGATFADTVSAAYSANGTALACSGSAIYNGVAITTLGAQLTPPTSATVTSTGSAPHSSSTVMDETLSISASNVVTSQALGYAIFTSDNLIMQGENILNQVSGQGAPNIYVGQTITCENGDISAGGLTAFAAVNFSGTCTMEGNLVSTYPITLANGAVVGGSVTSYSGGIMMSGTASVAKNATAYNGFLQLDGSSQIDGNAEATGSGTSTFDPKFTNGTIDFANLKKGTPSANGEILGNATAQGAVTYPSSNGGHCPPNEPNDGWVCGTLTQDDSALTTPPTPTPVSFPNYDPTPTTWSAGCALVAASPCPASELWNVIEVGGTGQPSCSSFFTSYSSGANDVFMNTIETATQPTVIYAPSCSVLYQNTHTFNLNNDIALQVQSLTLENSNTIQATSTTPSGTPPYGFSILASAGTACSTSTVDVSLSNETVVEPSVTLGIYTEGQVDAANSTAFDGQILACGGFTGANYFEMNFVPGPLSTIPGSTSASTPPVETIVDKHLVQG